MAGAIYLDNKKTRFRVWAPFKDTVQVIFKEKKEPVALEKEEQGYWSQDVEHCGPGTLYKFKLNGEEFPDPASRSQPEGVHSWSQVIAKDFSWNDNSWKGIPMSKMIIYELHVGTFTPEGTFKAVINKLDHLLELGVNTIEILPISQFPGERNWGYDGVYPYAAQDSYGGALGLKEMINACHQKGIAVILDAVYNHMGPEGNYLSQYGPYFTEKYQTPWGAAINFDDKYSDEVRKFFLENALMWLEEFHFDGLRLDAIHEIIDRGAKHFLKELSLEVDELQQKTKRELILIAESDLNDTKIINPYEKGGYGLEGQWVDDFHHSLHTLLTGENEGYYKDYGSLEVMAKAYTQGFVYDGVYSQFRKRTVGNSPTGLAPYKFVVCIQNHDQIGNRMLGERLGEIISFEGLKLAAGVVLSSPFVPMLYMGEEFAEDQPFQYFVSHGDKDLVKAVQEGRKREFKYFYDKLGDFPDPQAKETFQNSKLNWNFKDNEKKLAMFTFYKQMLHLRNKGAFQALRENKIKCDIHEERGIMKVHTKDDNKLLCIFNFSKETQKEKFPYAKNSWEIVVASASKEWGGPASFPQRFEPSSFINISPQSFIIVKEHSN